MSNTRAEGVGGRPQGRRWPSAIGAMLLLISGSAWATGTAGTASAGGTSCVTALGPVTGVADTVFDPAGNLWFLEGNALGGGAPAIGRRAPDGAIAQFGAGLVSHDQLKGITLGPDGNVWFTSFFDRVGRITPSGVITVFSDGITSGSHPAAITGGPDGNVWFTEASHDAIGRITPAGVVTELPFVTDAGGADGITTGPDGNLWFTAKFAIDRMTPTGEVTGFTHGLEAQYDAHGDLINGTPYAITAGPDGNLWYSKFVAQSAIVGRITTDGVVSEFEVPLPPSQPSVPAQLLFNDIAPGPGGTLWYSSMGGAFISRFTPNADGVGLPGQFSAFTDNITVALNGVTLSILPGGLSAGPDGTMWYGETNGISGRIGGLGRITPNGAVTLGTVSSYTPPNDITRGPDGRIWFAGGGLGDGVGSVTADGHVINFPVSADPNNQVVALTAGGDGNIWFAEWSSGGGAHVGRITPAGVVTTFSDETLDHGVVPRGIAAGPDGNVWFTEPTDDHVGRITPDGVITQFGVDIIPGGGPLGITGGPDGSVWFTEPGGAWIGRITPTGSVTNVEVGAGAYGDAKLTSITAGPDGNLWFIDLAGRIGRITPAGDVTMFTDGITATDVPTDIVAADGALWFTLKATGQIGRITTDGHVSLFSSVASNTPAYGYFHPVPQSQPSAITAASDGTLWWGDAYPGSTIAHGFAPGDIGGPCVPVQDGGHYDQGGFSVTVTGGPVYLQGVGGDCSSGGTDPTTKAQLSGPLTVTVNTVPANTTTAVINLGAQVGYGAVAPVPPVPVTFNVPASGVTDQTPGFTCADANAGKLPFAIAAYNGQDIVGLVSLSIDLSHVD